MLYYTPMEPEQLPPAIQGLASELFAGETGFSYAGMDMFFCCQMDRDLSEIELPPSEDRREAFRNWLLMFPLEKQKLLLLHLCQEPMVMHYGWPEAQGRKKLAMMVAASMSEGAAMDVAEKLDPKAAAQFWHKALTRQAIVPGEAITAARGLLDTACRHILDEADLEYEEDASLPSLCHLVAATLGLSPGRETEDTVKGILSSCLDAIETLNALHEATGKEEGGAGTAPRHGELAVNLAGAMATFLIATWDEKRQ